MNSQLLINIYFSHETKQKNVKKAGILIKIKYMFLYHNAVLTKQLIQTFKSKKRKRKKNLHIKF